MSSARAPVTGSRHLSRARRWALRLHFIAVLFCALVLSGTMVAQQNVRAEPTAFDRVARLVERGDARRGIGDTINAAGLYRDAITAGPRRSEGYVALGDLYLSLGEPSRALEVFEVGVRMSGRGEALWLGLVRALTALGQTQRALDALRSLRTVAPDSLSGLEQLAQATEAAGAFIEALSARRARLDRLLASGASETITEERARIRALEYILGAGERVRGAETCAEPTSALLRALARCR